MTDLVACLSSNEKIWPFIEKLVNEQDWKKVFLVTSEFGKNNFKCKKEIDFIVIDTGKPVSELVESVRKNLNGKITDLEVALNLVSGSGKEHMAILSALLKLGVGIRLMAVTKEGVMEL
ncbi:hypothetical protein CMO83_01195 [Candidatus Woesearchaeota archaeon]|jgi:hypothetical protein|nr:hypothetical protein [Candidatus Woesearchaeota archaeon]|tara:strand:- start:17454 stop:17810 length:357 start_codon:yes stop_codon:yes gene_type:complete